MLKQITFLLVALVLASGTFGQQVFTDQIAGSGLNAQRGWTLALYDHNNDGLTDVVWGFGNPIQVQLMRNNGNLTFSDISASAGFQYLGSALQTLDVDNNGWIDIIQTDWQNNIIHLSMNDGGTLTTYAIQSPINIDGPAAFMDHDGNGSIDFLFVVMESNGSRSFRVVYNDYCAGTGIDSLQTSSLLAGPFAVGINPVPYCFDYDNDQDADLLFIMDGTNNSSPGGGYHYQPVKIWRNDAGTFTDATVGSGFGIGHGSGCTFWDYDNDGFLDLTFGSGDCCDNPNVTRTYHNNGNGTFTDVSASVLLKSGNHYFFGAMVADIDNDRDNDIYWSQGAWTTSQLFVNNGSSFTGNVAASFGLNLSGGLDQNGAPGGIRPSWFDADNDGDLDVLCSSNGLGDSKLMVDPLLPSAATNAHYLTIDLHGCSSGRSAINAGVNVYRAGTVTAQLSSSTLQGGLLQNRFHFGMGSSAFADSVVVHWPSGATTRSYQVPADQILTIQEDPGCTFVDCIAGATDIRISLKVALEGALRAGTNLMGDELRASSLLPLEEPYTALGYFHIGGGGDEETIPSVLSNTGPNAIVDWVVVELRDPEYNGFRVASRSALMQRDGDVVDMDGVSPVTFTTTPGTYFLSVKHRNHLGVMSAAPISFSSGIMAIDFTAASTGAFGTAARKAVDGRLVLWTGDATFNGQMKYTGAANDRDPILVRVGSTSPNNTTGGYFREDTNMDGVVKYTGTSNDRDPILVNVGSTAPNSVRNSQVP